MHPSKQSFKSKTSLNMSRQPSRIESKKLREQPKRNAKNRFRAIVRTVMANLWIGDIEPDEIIGDSMIDNIHNIVHKGDINDLLRHSEKLILHKPFEDRAESEIESIFKTIGGIKCFRRYPEDVRKKLVATTYFVVYGPGRVVVRQGQEAEAMYFVVKGEMEVTLDLMDHMEQKMITKALKTLNKGDMFGEVSLLYGIPRTATVTTLTACELLCLKKNDFDRVLKLSLKKQWDAVRHAMLQFPYFNDWAEVPRRECCMMSDIRHYEKGDAIIGKGGAEKDVKRNYVHFVLTGSCSLIQRMVIIGKGDRARLYADQSECPPHPPGRESIFVQVAIYSTGGTFGLGENMAERTVVALGDTSCLLIPLYILERNSATIIWTRIKQFLDTRVPTLQVVYRKYKEQQKWESHRTDLYGNLALGTPSSLTTMHDVPYYWRVMHAQPQLGENFKGF